MGLSLSRLTAGAALVVACVCVAPGIAYAADEAAAETYFQAGLAAMKRSDFAVACDAFFQSNRSDPSPGTQINLAVCYEKQKKWASAWTWYRSAVGLAQQRGQKERQQLADESATRLKSQMHYVVVSVKEALTDLVVKRDGSEVAIAVGGQEVPLPIDPGEHTFEVTARGKKPYTQKLTVADTPQTERVEIPKLEDAVVEDKGVSADKPVASGPPPRDGTTQRTAGLIAGGAGIAAGIAGIVFFAVAKSEESERIAQRKAAATATPAEAEARNVSAKTHDEAARKNQLGAIILGAGSVVLIGVGAVLYFTAPKAAEKAAKSPIVPLLGSGFAGVGLSGAF